MLGRTLAACALILLLVACSDSRKDIAARITPEEAKELRLDAGRLYKELREKRAPEFLPVRPPRWPARFKKYKPMRVGVYRDGVVLALEGDALAEQGIHILPVAMDLAPTRGRVKYDKIQEGIYWYQLGK